MIEEILAASREIQNGRNLNRVMGALLEEVDEVEEEVDIAMGLNDSPHGEDGVFGEAIDVMLCSIDLMFVNNPNVTPEQIKAYALKKLQKWKDKEEANDRK